MVLDMEFADSSDNDSSDDGQNQKDSSDDSDNSSSNHSDEEAEPVKKKASKSSQEDSDEEEEDNSPKAKPRLASESSDSSTDPPKLPKSKDSAKSSDKEDSDNEIDGKGDRDNKSDDEDNTLTKTKTDEIFGNALSSSEDEEKKEVEDEDLTPEERERRQEAMRQLAASSDEDEGPRRQIMELTDSYPNLKINLGKGEPVFFRPPNFLSIEPKPFNNHPEAYQREVDDDEIIDEEGRARLKLRIENTIRWRWVKDPKTGEYKKQSNAKIVKWSDGTMSMYLGDEIFEVQRQDAMPNMHLYTRVGPALQAQKIFKHKYTFRPHSTDTVTHRKLTMNMADKSNKGPKVKLVNEVGMNPERQRREMVKKEEESLRAAARRTAQQRRVRERAREVGLTSGFIEGDDSGEEGDLGAIKRNFKQQRPYHSYYSDDSEEDERSKKLLREAKIIDSDSDDNNASTSRKERTKHRIIDSDDED